MIIDSHIHCALSGAGRLKRDFMAADTAERHNFFRSTAKAYAERGVTALRDGGDQYGVGKIFKAIAREYGIIYKTPVKALYKKGHYGDFLGVGIENLADCSKKVKALFLERPDFVKIVLTGIMSFENFGEVSGIGFTKAELSYIIKAAQDAGLRTMVHVNTPRAIMMAIEAGADTVEHGYMIDDTCIEALRETGTIWVPTLAPFANIACCGAADAMAPYREVSRRYFEGHRKQVKKAAAAGVEIGLGSDGGSPLVHHGQGSLDELRYLLACGLEAAALLATGKKILEL